MGSRWRGSVMVLGVVTMLSGCAAVDGMMKSIGLKGGAADVIETIFAAQVAGEYEVRVTKDEKVLLIEKWACTQNPTTGKLTGCHKK